MSETTEVPDGDLSLFPHFLNSFHSFHTQLHFIICHLKKNSFPQAFFFLSRTNLFAFMASVQQISCKEKNSREVVGREYLKLC